jgi:hypothetical protein
MPAEYNSRRSLPGMSKLSIKKLLSKLPKKDEEIKMK